MKTGLSLVLFSVGYFLFVNFAMGGVVQVAASKDNTLYEDAAGSISNGAGSYLFCGTTDGLKKRRALISFDVAAALPAGASITNATLELHMDRTTSMATNVYLYRVTQNWGEGASDAANNEGQGAPAAAGDATWLSCFFGTGPAWASAGGDFAPSSSAVQSVSGAGAYTWSGPSLTSDVVGWFTNPATNFGWILIGDESAGATSKRFGSRSDVITANRPQLTITFDQPSAAINWTLY